MPGSQNSPRNESPSTYFVQDRQSKDELARLKIQDQMLTRAMGGVLPEQPDPSIFRRVLDVGCGSGNWIAEFAQTYTTTSLVGIDISQRMIDYARTQASSNSLDDRTTFFVMDALKKLEFPDASFDLVNMRLGSSFLRTWDWPALLSEFSRVTRPGGIIRVTDSQIFQQSTSPAQMQHSEMIECAFYRSGHLFTTQHDGLTSHLISLLKQHCCRDAQVKAYDLEYQAGTAEGQAYYKNAEYAIQTLRPFLEKWGCATRDYDAICKQALEEMRQPDFHATSHVLTVWGRK